MQQRRTFQGVFSVCTMKDMCGLPSQDIASVYRLSAHPGAAPGPPSSWQVVRQGAERGVSGLLPRVLEAQSPI
jgi:hypothetical protein